MVYNEVELFFGRSAPNIQGQNYGSHSARLHGAGELLFPGMMKIKLRL